MAADLSESHKDFEDLHVFSLEDALALEFLNGASATLINAVIELSLFLIHLQNFDL